MKTIYLTISILLMSCVFLKAQVITRGLIKDQIKEYRKTAEKLKTEIFKLPSVDNASLISRDIMENKVSPLRFGKSFPVDIDIQKEGAKNLVENGTLYSFEVESENAHTLNFVFNDFNLSEGSELIIYNSDKSMVIGFTTTNQIRP